MTDRLHDAIDAVTRALERVHDVVGQLRQHHLFPTRKVFYGGAVAALSYVVVQLLGIDNPYSAAAIPAGAGYITSYLFTDGAAVRHLDGGHAIEAEESFTTEAERRRRDDESKPLEEGD